MAPSGKNNKEKLYIMMAQHTDNHGNVYPWDHLYNHYYRKEKMMFDSYPDIAFGNQFAGMFFHEVEKDMDKVPAPCCCCVSKPEEDRLPAGVAPKPVIDQIFREMGKQERNFNVGGSYSQPVSFLLGEEAAVREFLYAEQDLTQFYGHSTDMYVVSENTAATYMPQILKDFGFRSAVMRCHYAPLGFPPEYSDSFISWEGADGSTIPTVPTYTGDNRRRDFDGMNESEAALLRWGFEYSGMGKLEALDHYYEKKKKQGIDYVVITCFEDTHFEDFLDEAFYKELREVDPNGEKYVFCTPNQLYRETPLLNADNKKLSSYSDWLFSMNNGYFGEEYARMNNGIYHRMNDTEILRSFRKIAGDTPADEENAIIDEAYREHLMAEEHGTYECWGCFSLPKTQISRAHTMVDPIYEKTLDALTDKMKSDQACNLAVYNTQSFCRRELCRFKITCSKEQKIDKIVDSATGKELEFDIYQVDYTDTDANITGAVMVDMETFSAKTLHVMLVTGGSSHTGRIDREMLQEIRDGKKVFSNAYYNLKLNESGEIVSLTLKDQTAVLTADQVLAGLSMNGRFFDMDTRDKFRDQKSLGKIVVAYENRLSTVLVVKGKIDRADYGLEITIYHDLPYFDVNVVADIDNNLGVGWMLPPESMGAEWGEANANQKYLRMCMNFTFAFQQAGRTEADPYDVDYPLYAADAYNAATNLTVYTTFQPETFQRRNVANTIPGVEGYRPNHIYDYMSKYFVDVADTDASRGLAVLTKGFSGGTYDGNSLKVVLAQNQHSARSGYLNQIYHYGCREFVIYGNTRYEMRIMPHGAKLSRTDCQVGKETVDLLKLSLAYQSPLIARQFGKNEAGQYSNMQFVAYSDNDHVIVSNLRQQDDSVFARAFEYKGEKTDEPVFTVGNKSVQPVSYSMNYQEERKTEDTNSGKYKIKTYKLL